MSTARINRAVPGGRARSPPTLEIAAVASRDRASAESYAPRTGIERAYGSYDALLADPEVEAVYIPLPNSLHVEWSMRALRSRQARAVREAAEPPGAEVERAFDVAEREGRLLMEAFMYRHNPQTRRLTELVAAGAVGTAAVDPRGVQLPRDRPGQCPPELRRSTAAR